jgi:two-component system, NtrC family, response regulator PilR
VIAEDDADLRTVLQILLMTEGWMVEAAATLDDARAFIEAEMPDLLVLDVQLADHVAGELLAELACRVDGPVTVLVSGSEEVSAIARRYGVAYARKPIDIDVLMASIDRAITQSRRPILGQPRATWVSIRPSLPA